MPGPLPPDYREPPPNATWEDRMMCMTLNFLQHPTLLEAAATGIMWDCQPTPASDLYYDNPNPHFSQTILVTDPTYPQLFQLSGINQLPNIHRVTFAIGTRIAERERGLAHELLLTTEVLDSAGQRIPRTDGGFSGDIFLDVGGWWSIDGLPPLVPILRDIFGDWKCVVEYFKLMCDGSGERVPHPLIHMGILGQGQLFRKAVVRVAGSMLFGIGVPEGFQDNRRWQELRDGNWMDL